MTKIVNLALTSVALASLVLAGTADARPGNPPGPAGGAGTNWYNPPGPAGGSGAGPRWHHHNIPVSWGYRGFRGGYHWYWHPRGYWCTFDRDGNPPGPRGGRGTNWENPRGPAGGPGASPNSASRRC